MNLINCGCPSFKQGWGPFRGESSLTPSYLYVCSILTSSNTNVLEISGFGVINTICSQQTLHPWDVIIKIMNVSKTASESLRLKRISHSRWYPKLLVNTIHLADRYIGPLRLWNCPEEKKLAGSKRPWRAFRRETLPFCSETKKRWVDSYTNRQTEIARELSGLAVSLNLQWNREYREIKKDLLARAFS